MTLQQLEYILALNQFRHFGKAAEHCGVTQPTLSALIQKLEEELDIRIFDRTRQSVSPTPAGRSWDRRDRCWPKPPASRKWWLKKGRH